MPPDNFWDGLAAAFERASGDIIAVGCIIVAVLFVLIKYYLPERREQRKFQADMEQKRLELEIKQQQDSTDIQRENIETRARQTEILSNLSAQSEVLTSIANEILTRQNVLTARIEDSKGHSENLIVTMSDMKADVKHMKDQVEDIHGMMINGPEVSD